jgi:hypothetical protein
MSVLGDVFIAGLELRCSLTALVPEILLPVTCTSSRRQIRDHVSNVYVQPVEIKFLYGVQSLRRGVE